MDILLFKSFLIHTKRLSEKFRSELTAALDLVRQEFSDQFSELIREFQNQGSQVALTREAIAAHEQALTGLTTLPSIVDRHERNMRQALADMRTSIESGAIGKPKLSLVGTEKFSGEQGEVSNKGFIENYLTKHPEARNAEIIEEATKLGLTLSQSYVSQIRKAVKEQSA